MSAQEARQVFGCTRKHDNAHVNTHVNTHVNHNVNTCRHMRAHRARQVSGCTRSTLSDMLSALYFRFLLLLLGTVKTALTQNLTACFCPKIKKGGGCEKKSGMRTPSSSKASHTTKPETTCFLRFPDGRIRK